MTKTDTIQFFEIQIRERLLPVSETPGLDSRALLAEITGQSPAWILAHPEETVSQNQADHLASALTLLDHGLPLPYVIGRQEFYGLDFQVSPAVLIPRPETELLVEEALGWLSGHPEKTWAVDLGTGSGCIAVTLAVKVPALHVAAVDLSAQALLVAGQNVKRYGVSGQVYLVQGDLLEAFSSPVDLICANLPYIPQPALTDLTVAQYEPMLALNGGLDGLDLIRRMLESAPGCLAPGGLLLMEIEAGQGEIVPALARQAFPTARIDLIQDLSGRDRLVRIER